MYRNLAPCPWFDSVDTEEYDRRYRAEILDLLDPRQVVKDLVHMAGDNVGVVCCFERVGDPRGCHRALVSQWFAAAGIMVPEIGFEHLPLDQHPLVPQVTLL